MRTNNVRRGHSLSDIARILALPETKLRIDAEFSEDCRYRYVWRLRWSDGSHRKPLLVVGLIASTADERQDDPTVRKCIEIAARDGYSELIMMNLFAAWPTPDHRKAALAGRLVNPVGPDNDRHITEQARKVRESAGTIVVAWGDDGWSRHASVLPLLASDDLRCFGKTVKRFPRHASMRGKLARNIVIQPYS